MASQTLQTIRNGWAPEIKRLNDNLEKLEASLIGTDECVIDRGTTHPPNSPRDMKYNLRSHVVDIE